MSLLFNNCSSKLFLRTSQDFEISDKKIDILDEATWANLKVKYLPFGHNYVSSAWKSEVNQKTRSVNRDTLAYFNGGQNLLINVLIHS